MIEEKKNPVLTIGIPTYNRANYLDICLGWIYEEVGNDQSIEILVSDNCSTDNTEEIVKKYKDKYSNLIYHKQSKNEGFSKNLKTVLDLANGEFINPHGDDDFFNKGIIYEFIKMIKLNRDVSIMYAIWSGNPLKMISGRGVNDYLNKLNGINFITSMLVNNKE